jgi:hypothetical protein
MDTIEEYKLNSFSFEIQIIFLKFEKKIKQTNKKTIKKSHCIDVCYELLRRVYLYKLRSLLSRGNQTSKQIQLNFFYIYKYINHK